MSKVSLSSEKPRLNFWQIWNMSFGFLGIQFGFALQNANTSRIFETLGADTKNLAFYWLAAPVTGLLVQPIIGYLSDRTWHPYWGRRRPFFAIGAIFATIALIIMPNSPLLWIAIGMLWIMDASINISMEPFRAFVGDMLPSDQRTRGFAMQSFFIGTGAVVASALPYLLVNVLGIPDTSPDGGIPPNVKWSFYMGAIAFFGAVSWTVFTTKEYPPEEGELDKEKRNTEPLNIKYTPQQYLNRGLILLAAAAILAVWFTIQQLDPQLYIVSGIFALFGFSYVIGSFFMKRNKYRNGFVQIIRDFQNMPKTMVQLAFVQFFSWFALFAMWIYTTNGITSHIYDMKLSADQLNTFYADYEKLDIDQLTLYDAAGNVITDPQTINEFRKNLKKEREDIGRELEEKKESIAAGRPDVVASVKLVNFFLDVNIRPYISETVITRVNEIQKEYNTGANWVGILFAVYNGFAAIAAIFLPAVARATSRKITHLIMLSIGGVGLLSFFFVTNPDYLMISMIGVGVAWASILSMPYAMLSGSIPPRKMGYYMGIFNFFIVIPQIVAASVLGFLVTSFFDSQFIYALVLGGISMIISGLLSLRVDDKDDVGVTEDVI